MKTVKGFLFTADTGLVTAIDHDNTAEQLRDLLQCEQFTMLWVNEKNAVWLSDDEPPKGKLLATKFSFVPYPIVGNALFLGGDLMIEVPIDATLTIGQVTAMIEGQGQYDWHANINSVMAELNPALKLA